MWNTRVYEYWVPYYVFQIEIVMEIIQQGFDLRDVRHLYFMVKFDSLENRGKQ